MAKQKVSSEVIKKKLQYTTPAWALRSKYYMLDFLIALISLSFVAVLIDKMLFSLMQYVVGGTVSYDVTQLWTLAMTVVWVPVMVIFYQRARSEELNRSEVATTKLRRFFLYLFMIATLFIAAGFAFAALFSLLQMMFGIVPAGDTFIALTLPALVAATLHGYIFRSFMSTNTVASIKRFVTIVAGLATILFAVTLVITAVRSGGAMADEKISNDLVRIGDEVRNYANDNNKLPSGLSDLPLSEEVKGRADRYGYSYATEGRSGFKLCANFRTDTGGKGDEPEIMPLSYRTSPDYSKHGKGQVCFKESSVLPYYGNGASSSAPSSSNSLYDDILKSMPSYTEPSAESLSY